MDSSAPHPAAVPPWMGALSVALASARADPAARFAQLATRGGDGAPRCRTVVVRSLVDAESAMLFCTDARSEKVPEIEADPRAELCWYIAACREQFRLAGRVVLVRAGDAALPWLSREALWSRLPNAMRASFAGPPPGAPRRPDTVFARVAPAAIPDAFVAAAFVAETADHLRIGDTPHARMRWSRGERGWIGVPICP